MCNAWTPNLNLSGILRPKTQTFLHSFQTDIFQFSFRGFVIGISLVFGPKWTHSSEALPSRVPQRLASFRFCPSHWPRGASFSDRMELAVIKPVASFTRGQREGARRIDINVSNVVSHALGPPRFYDSASRTLRESKKIHKRTHILIGKPTNWPCNGTTVTGLRRPATQSLIASSSYSPI